MEEIKELVRVSNEIGRFKELVQAGGGNTSVKTKDGKIIIKASGFTFSEMTETSGFSILDQNKVSDFFKNLAQMPTSNENEDVYNQTLANSMVDSNLPKPSMEAGMHIFLHRIVVHTHPIMANIINCMKGGEKIARELFSETIPEILWLGYKNPGYALAKEIKNKVYSYESKNGVKPELIFLKNHGIIVSSDDPKCANMTIEINEKIYDYLKHNFGLERFVDPQIQIKNGICFNDSEIVKRFVSNLDENKHFLSKFLIPDDAVYCSGVSIQDINDLDKNNITFVDGVGIFYPWNEKKSVKVNEMLTAKLYILSVLSKTGEVDFLRDEDVNYVLNMESEKYRQKLNEAS